MTSMVQLRHIEKSYQEANKKRLVFSELSLDVKAGTSLAIVGRSGSGKSTLLNLISGIDIPDRGEVYVKDENMTALNETQRTLFRRRHIGFVFQSYNLIPTLTARENLRMPLDLNGAMGKPERNALVLARLADVNLESRADSFPERLSGGEQQRIAIARAIIHNPDLILADEPTGNLDEINGQQVLKLLFELVTRDNKTLIIVTHSHDIAAMADATLRVSDMNVASHG